MKCRLLFLCAVLLSLKAVAQTSPSIIIQHVPGYYDSTRVVAFGDSFVTTITNTGTAPAAFFIRYRLPGLEHLGFSDDTISAILQRAITGHSADSDAVEMIMAEANIIKSFLFNDGLTPAKTIGPQTAAKDASVTGEYNAFYHQICGNFVQQAASDLHRADSVTFAWDNMRSANMDGGKGNHSVLELNGPNGWIMYDFTPGMPVLSVGTSVEQVIANPGLITDAYLYKYDSILLPGDHSTISAYQGIYEGATVSYSPMVEVTRKESGVQILSPGSTLTYTGVANTLVVDTFQPQGLNFFNAAYPVIVQAYTTGSAALFDSLTGLVKHYYPAMTEAQAASVFSDPNFPHFLIMPYLKWWQSPSGMFWNHTVPVKQLTVPPAPDTMIIGNQLRFASFVTSAECDNPMRVEDTSFTGFEENLWTPEIVTLTADAGQLIYMDTGFIPANTSATFLLSYNPEREDAFYGFDIEKYDSSTTLQVTTQYFKATADTTTTGVFAANNKCNFSVFPDPATNYITVAGLAPNAPVEILNVAGETLLAKIADPNGRAALDVSALAAGVYLLAVKSDSGSWVRKFVKE